MLISDIFKILIVSALFSSTPLLACISCDEEPLIVVSNQAIPHFPKSFHSEEMTGTVSFKLSVDSFGIVQKIEQLKLQPTNMPKEAIIEMIRKTKYSVKYKESKLAKCSAKRHELTFEFPLPTKLELDLDLGIK